MILNIISTQIGRTRVTGPQKVLKNTLKGLDKIGVKYVFNQPINKYKYNWLHDDQKAIIESSFVGKAVLIGPNTAVLPKDLPKLRKKLPNNSIYLHPSRWCVNVWKFLGFDEVKLDYWATGIDTDEFEKLDRKNKRKILLYFKQRDPRLLSRAKKILEDKNLKYEVIHYGFYEEKEYIKALKECKFGIWIGCSESQGIALQEALSTNLPLIVLDAKNIFDTIPIDTKNYLSYNFPQSLKNINSTTAPYFDERCGILIDTIDELSNSIDYMQKNIKQFKPREYIKENLSLEISAKKLISFFDAINTDNNKTYNYKKISTLLFFVGLLRQKWAWRWILKRFGVR